MYFKQDMNYIPHKVMPPCLQSKDNSRQLEIMREIVLFMTAQLS
jgi:hypothetical protein